MIRLSAPDLSGNEMQYIKEVLDSGQLSMGEKTLAFEEAFRKYFSVKHAIACSSGTLGLEICFKALLELGWIRDVDATVAISSETFGATMNAVINGLPRSNIVPVGGALAHQHIGVYVPCHIMGEPAPEFMRSDTPHDYMIEDACEAIGAKWEEQYLGTMGLAGVFGFYPNKQITTGEGGMIITDDDHFAKMCRQIVNQGRLPGSPHEVAGTNARLSELHAAIGLAQMERIDEILDKRSQVASRYVDMFSDKKLNDAGISLPSSARESWFAFDLTSSENVLHGLHKHLLRHDIQSAIYFPAHECFPGFKWHTRICIPFHNNITADEQKAVVDVVHGALL